MCEILLSVKIELTIKWQTKKKTLGTNFRFIDLQNIRTGKNLGHVVSPLTNEEYDAQNNPLGYTVTHSVS